MTPCRRPAREGARVPGQQPPLLRGGQKRDAEELEAEAVWLLMITGIALAIVVANVLCAAWS